MGVDQVSKHDHSADTEGGRRLRNLESIDTDELNNVHWPEEYDAVGDGSTDDVDAINSALSNHSFVAFRPNTTYFVNVDNSTVQVPPETAVYIPQSTTILADLDNTTPNRILENANPTAATKDANIQIWGGGMLDGQTSATSEIVETEGGALNLFNIKDCYVGRLRIRGAREYGLEVGHAVDSWISVDARNSQNDNISVSDGGSTAYGSDGDSVTSNLHLYECYAEGAQQGDLEVDDGPQSVFVERSTLHDLSGATHSGNVNPKSVQFHQCWVNQSQMPDVENVSFHNCILAGTSLSDGFDAYHCTRPVGNSELFRCQGNNTVENCYFLEPVSNRSWGYEINGPNVRIRGHQGDIPSDGDWGVLVTDTADIGVSTIQNCDFGPDRPDDVRLRDSWSGLLRIRAHPDENVKLGGQGTLPDPGGDDRVIIDGEAEESASAEEPQRTYPPGTMVRFTDSGDGSGTGTYLIDRNGNPVQLSSNT